MDWQKHIVKTEELTRVEVLVEHGGQFAAILKAIQADGWRVPTRTSNARGVTLVAEKPLVKLERVA